MQINERSVLSCPAILPTLVRVSCTCLVISAIDARAGKAGSGGISFSPGRLGRCCSTARPTEIRTRGHDASSERRADVMPEKPMIKMAKAPTETHIALDAGHAATAVAPRAAV